MKNLLTLLGFLFATACLAQEPAYKATTFWASPEVLTTSESVCYDRDGQILFVSCIHGNPTEKDGNGFISKLSLAGEIVVLKWAENLNAPKGMGISKGFLYVTDIDRVVKLDLEDGKTIAEFNVDEAKFLNDISTGPDGSIYISDMYSTNIYRIKDDNLSLWLSSDLFINPNGLNYTNDELLVGTENGIFAVGFADRTIRHLVKDTGGIDGLELFDNGYFLISDWSGKVQLVHPDKEHIVLFNTTDRGINAADIEYIAERKLLLVPTFMDNRVVAYEILEEGN